MGQLEVVLWVPSVIARMDFRNFIPHEYLAYNKNRNTQYLDEDDDTLLFQIPWIKVNSM